MPTLLKKIPSKSSPSIEYELLKGDDGNVYCSCPAWKFSKGAKSCTHVREYMGSHEARLSPEEIEELKKKEAAELGKRKGEQEKRRKAEDEARRKALEEKEKKLEEERKQAAAKFIPKLSYKIKKSDRSIIWPELDKNFHVDEKDEAFLEIVHDMSQDIPQNVLLTGPQGCLAGDTFIRYEIRSEDGKRSNHKGGPISRLYQRFNGKRQKTSGASWRTDVRYYVPSINDDGYVVQNEVGAVVYSGEKECFEVSVTGGEKIVTTSDHEFYVGDKYLPLASLKVGDSVYVHRNVKCHGKMVNRQNRRAYLFVKNHPVAGTKVVEGKYEYKRLARSRAVMEAKMNGLSLEAYIERLNTNKLDGLTFLSRDQHVHHVDENFLNDDPANLIVLVGYDHNHAHAVEKLNNLRCVVVEDTITSIKPVGKRKTYDIKMKGPYNNVVANGVVVHNCGKTELAVWFTAKHDRPMVVMNCASIRETRDWFGYKEAKGGTVSWHVSDFVKAIQTPNCVIVLDEFNRLHSSLHNTLYPLLDARRQTWVEEVGEMITVAPGVVFFATCNIGAQHTGTFTLDAALEDRFGQRVECNFLPKGAEIKVLTDKTGIPEREATRLVEFANDIRAKVKGEAKGGTSLTRSVSTRQLLQTAILGRRFKANGKEYADALLYTVIPYYAEDERPQIQLLMQGKFPEAKGKAR